MSSPVNLNEKLSDICRRMKVIEGSVLDRGTHLSFAQEDAQKFASLLKEAMKVIEFEMGEGSDCEKKVVQFWSDKASAPDFILTTYVVREVRKLLEESHREIVKKQGVNSSFFDGKVISDRPSYVSGDRIAELKALPKGKWDLTRLIRMLEELNDAYERGNFVTVSMLVRAIKDHVPPIFSATNFAGVFNNASKSLKGNLERLENSLKHIADGQLHSHIRNSEVLPTDVQVDFRNDLDVLLGEVVRMVKA